jgi:hypothetical protein
MPTAASVATRSATPSSVAPSATSRAASVPCVSGSARPIASIHPGNSSSGTFTPHSSSIRK